jgi:hypothetical protein
MKRRHLVEQVFAFSGEAALSAIFVAVMLEPVESFESLNKKKIARSVWQVFVKKRERI